MQAKIANRIEYACVSLLCTKFVYKAGGKELRSITLLCIRLKCVRIVIVANTAAKNKQSNRNLLF